jgi:stage II sporulation protein D
LKAQAVAARTYTLYCKQFCADKHADADVCSDPACCKAYADDSALRARWGADYDTYIAKIKEAVAETDGEYMVYEGEPILAVFHSSSDGYTEDSGNVWNTSLPYLQSVKSPETSAEVPGYVTSVTVSLDDFKSTILEQYPEATFDGEPASWIGPSIADASGRLASISIGGVELSGTTLRSLFALRSASIEITANADNIVLTTTGYGHGVGMSQYGANTLAAQGKNYEEILQWYYTGAVLRSDA